MPKRKSPTRGSTSSYDWLIELAAKAITGLVYSWLNSPPKIMQNGGAASPPPKLRAAGPKAKPPRPKKSAAWWKVLEIDRHSTASEIKTRYRTLMAVNHPDKVRHLSKEIQEFAERRAKEINAAYETALKDREA